MARIKKVNNYKNYKLLIPTVAVGIFAVLIALSFANLKQVSIYNLVGALFKGSITVNFDCGCDSKKIFIGSALGELCEVSAPDGYEFYSWKYGDTFVDEDTVINSKENITLVAMFKKPAEEEIWNYDYTGAMTSFVTPHDGVYTLEVWGASGGDVEGYNVGGYGGYAKGDYLLTTGDQLFIGVGGAANVKVAGYNGGGSAYDYGSYNVRAGGGGTHIGFNNDVIANTAKSDLIIVAGGGGGAFYSSGEGSNGGNGGGYIGGYTVSDEVIFMYGGTQTAGGDGMRGSDGMYGMGARGQSSSGSAGGGGLYGGSGHYGAGAGGSGYIGNDLLTNKAMYCYECETSNEISTRTISNTCVDVSPNEKCSKKGDGFARISFNHLYTIEELINDGMIWNYDYNGNDGTDGSVQDFIVPINGTYKLEAWGAQGGTTSSSALGGKGAYTTGTIYLEQNEKIYIYVGGAGGTSETSVAQNVAGGYNGGGNTVGQACCGRRYGSGGGATDIRLVGGAWNDDASLKSRIMVAAGGGGAFEGEYGVQLYNAGGYGGALTGGNGTQDYDAYCYGEGATQTSGGKITSNCYYSSDVGGGIVTGSFGIGGTDGVAVTGGGGGFYGGSRSGHIASAGGGSSFISGYAGSVAISSSTSLTPKPGCTSGTSDVECSYHYSGKIFTSPVMIAGNETMPNHDGNESIVGNAGNGYARITLISAN